MLFHPLHRFPFPTPARLQMLVLTVALVWEPTLLVRLGVVGGIHLSLLPIYRYVSAGPGWGYAGLGLGCCALLA